MGRRFQPTKSVLAQIGTSTCLSAQREGLPSEGENRLTMTDLATNVLYYGDNLDILRRYLPDATVDLVYLDPPFNSNRDYNVIFRDESGNATDAQLLAFEDTWHWGPSAEATYAYLTNTARHEGRSPDTVSTIIAALRAGIVGQIFQRRAPIAGKKRSPGIVVGSPGPGTSTGRSP
jgi:hypothetical protein